MAKEVAQPIYPADLAPEEWRPIQGYEGLYDISSWGRVRSWMLRTGSRITIREEPVIRYQGPGGLKGQYRTVALCTKSKTVTRYVHRLVAFHFIGPCPPKHECAHDDGIGHHNWVSNLSWKTRKANHADKHRHGTRQCGENAGGHKLTEAEVLEIIADGRRTSGPKLARKYNVSHNAIYAIWNKKSWTYLEEKAA